MCAEFVARVAVVASAAVGVIISCGVSLMAVRGGQDPIVSEALAYERFMGRWSRDLAPLLVRFAAVRDGDTLLDVGSGTGALTAALIAAAPSSASSASIPPRHTSRWRNPGTEAHWSGSTWATRSR